jgi:hypothetical protein
VTVKNSVADPLYFDAALWGKQLRGIVKKNQSNIFVEVPAPNKTTGTLRLRQTICFCFFLISKLSELP